MEKKLTAPNVDNELRFFDRGYSNPKRATDKVLDATKKLSDIMKPLTPLKRNSGARAIWVQVPRGELSDYGRLDELIEPEEEIEWKENYPEETCWYEVVINESYGRNGQLTDRIFGIGNKLVANIVTDIEESPYPDYIEEAIINLCELIIPAVEEAVRKVKEGTYNEEVNRCLPYKFRTGVIKRSILWERDPAWKEHNLDGVNEGIFKRFKELMAEGIKDRNSIGRMKSMTANDFFNACSLGYKACGYADSDESPVEQYLKHADGRDEGLTGKGAGLHRGSGIDASSPEAWDTWFFNKERRGGHPWEVCRGGNSTHVSLFVFYDHGELNPWDRDKLPGNPGYYFAVAGKHRPAEAIAFYTALYDAGYPVTLCDANEIMARLEATDYVGIVPRHVIPKYCESLFPAKYGHVIDFMHVYDEDMELFGDRIEWIPENPVEYIG